MAVSSIGYSADYVPINSYKVNPTKLPSYLVQELPIEHIEITAPKTPSPSISQLSEAEKLAKLSTSAIPVKTTSAPSSVSSLPQSELMEKLSTSVAKPSLFSRILTSSPQWVQNSVAYMKQPISSWGFVSKGLSKGTAFAENIAANSTKEGVKTAANGAVKFLGKAGQVAKGFPIVGFALNALGEIPDVIDGFKEGRGLSQTAKSTTKIAAGTLGTVAALALASNPIGWAAVAIGTVGYLAGNWIGDKVGSGLFGSNKSEEGQVAAAHQPNFQGQPQFLSATAKGAGEMPAYPEGFDLTPLPPIESLM